MSNLRVNNIAPATAGRKEVSIAAQVSGVAGTNPNHFVTYGQLGLPFSISSTVTQIYVDTHDEDFLILAKSYAEYADSALLSLAKLYADTKDADYSSALNTTLISIQQQINSLNAIVSKTNSKAWAFKTSQRKYTSESAIIISPSPSTAELESLGIYKNTTGEEMQISVVLKSISSNPNSSSALLIGKDFNTIAKDLDPHGTEPTSSNANTLSYIISVCLQDVVGNVSNLFGTISPNDYYRVVNYSGNLQKIITWQEYRTT